jgi:glycosyltransferase involved in cell wall biosynthesis
MASGTPVVASERAALPETCGHAALLVDPEDENAIADAVLAAALDKTVASRLREAGLGRAETFSWGRAAAEVDAVLRDAAHGGPPRA